MKYTESDLVSFGLYLLSEERKNKFKGKNKKERVSRVHHADLENWKVKQTNSEQEILDAYHKAAKPMYDAVAKMTDDEI